MVTNIVPGTTGAGALGVDTRYARPSPQAAKRETAPGGDRVELSSAAIGAARDSVRDGLMQVHQALAVGHDAQAMLVRVQAIARGEGGQAELDALLSSYSQRVDAVIAQGARVAAGEDIEVQAEPDAAPVAIAGVDLRLGDGAIPLAGARADDPALAQTAQRSLENLQAAMTRLLDNARALEAHQGFLGAAAGAAGVRHDLDADGARLLALQVRQGLEGAGAPIANVEPQAVLSLFRA